jgi:two-component system, cell cycle sensor histidine kinase and response regulator CckA
MLCVSDTGTGMSPDVAARIFEPFFTTKGAGKGTGLGLATVYAIVEQSGGLIAVDSKAGKGTTFTIYFPRVDGAGEADDVTTVKAAAGTETIMLVEDDASVREVAVRSLQAAGYRVLEAGDAAAALQLLAQHDGPVALLVTDVVLPGVGGRDLGASAQAARPDMRVLFTSGYTDDTVLAYGVRENTMQFIAKPYALSALARRVRDLLDRPSPATTGVRS